MTAALPFVTPEPGPGYVTEEFAVVSRHRHSPVGLAFDDLVHLALRRNPRRAQLLVSTVLGKHLPVDPLVVAGLGRLLGALVRRRLDAGPDGAVGPPPAVWSVAARAAVAGGPPEAESLYAMLLALAPPAGAPAGPPGLLTLGFAETATSVGHLVADQLGAPYLHSTRCTAGDVPVAAEFTEPHSHATGHLLRPTDPALLTGSGPLVMVDDELSTGRTALNVIEALHDRSPRPWYLLAGLVDVRTAESDELRVATAARLGCRIDVVALCAGRVEVPDGTVERVASAFSGAVTSAPPADAGGSVRHLAVSWPVTVPTGGRHGIGPADVPSFDAAVRRTALLIDGAVDASAPGVERILVVGTEELMYLPLRVALALAGLGRQVCFQSTTRSPVHVVDRSGYPIRRRIDYRRRPDDDSTGSVDRILYNATFDGAEADLIVVVDDGWETGRPDGLAATLARVTGRPVLAVTVRADETGPER